MTPNAKPPSVESILIDLLTRYGVQDEDGRVVRDSQFRATLGAIDAAIDAAVEAERETTLQDIGVAYAMNMTSMDVYDVLEKLDKKIRSRSPQ